MRIFCTQLLERLLDVFRIIGLSVPEKRKATSHCISQMSSTHGASNFYFVFLLDQPNKVLSFPILVDVADEQVYRIEQLISRQTEYQLLRRFVERTSNQLC